MTTVKIYDSTQLKEIPWSTTSLDGVGRALLSRFLQEGPIASFANTQTQFFLLCIDDILLPITVNETEYENGYNVSNYTGILIAEELLEKAKNRWLTLCSSPLLSAGKSFLKAAQINKTVIINNWLLSTNLYPALCSTQVGALLAFFTKRFPQHTLMFRSLNTFHNLSLLQTLDKHACRRIYKRDIFLYDPLQNRLNSTCKQRQRRDAKHIKEEGYELLTHEQITPDQFPRLLELYEMLYCKKHTRYSPHLTLSFLTYLMESKAIEFKALAKSGVIDVFSAFMKRDHEMIIPFCGYDTNQPLSKGLYPMLSAISVEEAKSSGLLLHHGSGAGEFKLRRGLSQHPEYVVVYDRHLPLHRQFPWLLSAAFCTYK